MLPAGGVGPAGTPLAGDVGITSRSESLSVSSWGESLARLWGASALMTTCAASSVGERGCLLRGAVRSAIAVWLCLRAGMRYGPSVSFRCL